LTKIKKQGFISTAESINFRRIIDVLNELYGKKYRGYQRATCKLGQYESTWFPKFDYLSHGKLHEGVRHWHNYMVTPKQDTLVEYPAPGYDLQSIFDPQMPTKYQQKELIHVFAYLQENNTNNFSYRFLGDFRYTGGKKAKEFGITLDRKPDDMVAYFKLIAAQSSIQYVEVY
jgi:hypothetical protein